MSGRRTDTLAVAQCQVQLMRLVTYGGSVSRRARDPLEWIPFGSPAPLSSSAMPDPRLGVVGSNRDRVLSELTYSFLPADQWAPATSGFFPQRSL